MDHFWSKRFNAFINDRIFLLRRLANGFAFLPLFIFLLGLYYYPLFLDWLPASFPLKLILALVLSWFITRGMFRSFLVEADIVYLSPIEQELRSFFNKCIYYNALVQGFLILSILIILSPLFFARVSMSASNFIIFVVIMLILKALNVMVLWKTLKIEDQSFFVIRLLLNFLYIYGLLLKDLFILVAALILTTTFVYFGLIKNKNNSRINWLKLLENEQRLDARFYHWIGTFVDHPHVLSKVKQRRILTRVADWIHKKPNYAFHYLYLKIFFRSELMGIVLRIVIMGLLMLWFLPKSYLLLGLYIVFLLMIGLQLYSFWHAFNNQFWVHLYPITKLNRNSAFLSTSFYILFIIAMILLIPIIVASSLQLNGISLFISVTLPYGFIYLFVSKKIRA